MDVTTVYQDYNSGHIEKVNNTFRDVDGFWMYQQLEAAIFSDSRHMKVVRLSALRTDRLYPAGNIPGTHFC